MQPNEIIEVLNRPISQELLARDVRFFTLITADVAFVDPGRGRGPADRIGLAVALCTLP
jgi:hypothetical protein